MCVVNAASERDMRVFAAGMLRAEAAGKRFLCRTAAAFVSASAGIEPLPPLGPADLHVTRSSCRGRGGLIVVGSYVPKTTSQVQELLKQRGSELEQLTVRRFCLHFCIWVVWDAKDVGRDVPKTAVRVEEMLREREGGSLSSRLKGGGACRWYSCFKMLG